MFSPLTNLLFYISEFFPATQKVYEKKGIKNPKEYYKNRMKEIDANPKLSIATMYGAGFTISSLGFIYVGFYHILKIIFFPTFEDSLGYVLTVNGILAFLTDNLLAVKQGQGVKYINEFNNIKDKKWRLKWAIITALVFPFSIWFMISTSTDGMIGKFLMNLHHTESANSILYRPNESAKTIDDLIIKR
jgi:hypothetical protein